MARVITISREFGSGGREIGALLSQKLQIPVYDKEIISMAAENGNIDEDFFEQYDEVINTSKGETVYHSVNVFAQDYEVPMSDQLFYLQSQMIRKLEKKGPCIFIGRCSDIITEDSFNVFICSSMKFRLDRLSSMYPDISRRQLELKAREIDRKRREYYSYYSGNEWANPHNYDLCLNSGKLGIQRCADIIAADFQLENGMD